MKRIVLAGLLFGIAVGGTGAAAFSAQHLDASAAPVLDAALANQKVDARLHQVLNGLLEQERATHPVRWAGR